MDPRALVRYNHAARRRFAEFFVKTPWEELSKNRETSHQSIANVFMHGANMEDWWFHYVLPGKEWNGPAWDGFTSAKAMLDRVQEVERKTEAWLGTLTEADLARVVDLRVGEDVMRMRLDHLLVEAVLEDVTHRGEIHAMLWQMDVAPPYESFAEWAAHRK